MWKDKRVFISGGSGVIGTVLTERLFEMGAVILVGDLKPRPKTWAETIKYRQGDLNYITKVELDDFAPEYFFHLAATFERSTETYEFWQENYDHNIHLSHHLMDCFKESNSLKKVIFASSYLIYNSELYNFEQPVEKAIRLKENDTIYPRNLCGMAKLLHEIELRFLGDFNKNGFKTVCARIFRSYGKNSRDIISRWVRALLRGEILTVYKKEGLFDYIFANEVAEGLIKLAESPATGIVNLGNDNARRVEEVINILKTHFPGMQTVFSDVDIPFEGSQANMDRFRQLTGWSPCKQLEDTIPEIISFEKVFGFKRDVENTNKNILITSVSKKIPLLKSIRKANLKYGNSGKVFGADVDKQCIGRNFVDCFWEMPRLKELTTEEFVQYCLRNQITAIIPTRDGELSFMAERREILNQNGISVMISPPEAIKVCLDKLLFYEQLSTLGFPVIKTIQNISTSNYDSYVVKERFGAGSRSIGLNLTKSEALLHAEKLNSPLFQPFILGREVSVDLYVTRKGKTKGAIVRNRELVVDGESQITSTIRNEKLENLCSNLAELLGLYGHIIFQVIIDETGEFHFIECNSRFGGASSLSIEAGLDSFYWFLIETSGADLDEYSFLRSRVEKRQIRYPEDLVVDDCCI